MSALITLSGVGVPGIWGHPIAAAVGGTSVPFLGVGYLLGGGSLPLVTQSISSRNSARRVSTSGLGLLASTKPGAGGCRTQKPHAPPPWAVPGWVDPPT